MAKKNKYTEEFKRWERMQNAKRQVQGDWKGSAEDAVSNAWDIIRAQNKLNGLLKQEHKIREQLAQATDVGEIRNLQEALKLVGKKHAAQKSQLAQYKNSNKALAGQVVNLKNIGMSLGKNAAQSLKVQLSFGNIWRYATDTDKAIRMTNQAMGVSGKLSNQFHQNVYALSVYTESIGTNMAEVAKAYDSFTDTTGRNILSSVETMQAIAELGKGSGLQMDWAAGTLGQLEAFNVTAQGGAQMMQDVINNAAKAGLKGRSVLEAFKSGIPKLNQFYVKDGPAGIARMAQHATNFRMNMDAAAGFAEKMWSLEGAIESAANLQVLGGQIGALGDPMKLFSQAQYDIEGFNKSITDSLRGLTQFNQKTKMFDVLPGEMRKLKAMAEATSIPFDELMKMTREVGKKDTLKYQIKPEILYGGGKNQQEMVDMLINSAYYSDKKGGFVIKIGNYEKRLFEVSKAMAGDLIKKDQTLKEMAQEAMTFDEKLQGTINMVKASLVKPLAFIMDKLGNVVTAFQKVFTMFGGDIKDASTVGTVVSAGIVAAGAGLAHLFGMAMMRMAGKAFGGAALGEIMKGAGAFGGAGGAGNMMGGGVAMGGAGKMGKFGKFGRGLGRFAKGGGIGIATGVAGLGMDMWADSMRGPDGKETTGSYWAGMGGSALEYAGTGAMLGTLIAPGLGTAIGAGAGALLGAGIHALSHEKPMAQGGIVTSPTRALIGETGKPEVVMPLSRLPSLLPQVGLPNTDAMGSAVSQIADRIAELTSSLAAMKFVLDTSQPLRVEFGSISIDVNGEALGDELLRDGAFMTKLTKIVFNTVEKIQQGGKN